MTRDDKDLFRDAMADVKPMKPRAKAQRPAPLSNRPAQHHAAPSVSSKNELVPGDGSAMDRANFERFRKGETRPERRLDLHGLTRAEAHAAVREFITLSFAEGLRMVLIITGKGKSREDNIYESSGVLRENLPHWLNAPGIREKILAFTEAQPKDGGAGAFYVMIKKSKR